MKYPVMRLGEVVLRLLLTAVTLSMHCTAGPGPSTRDDLYVLEDRDDPGSRTFLKVTREDDSQEEVTGCELLPYSSSTDAIVKKLSGKEIHYILKECTSFSSTRHRRQTEEEDYDYDEETVEEAEGNSHLVFPGTKWCGSGDHAKDYDDLGIFEDIDKCCRSHDLCNDTMASGETKHNLTNNSLFTKLNCKCDDEFYDCLSTVNGVLSNTIGRTYFNILRRNCYTKDYPDSNVCKKYRTFLKLSCKEYEKDTSSPKVYMWKSAKRYKKLPIPGIQEVADSRIKFTFGLLWK